MDDESPSHEELARRTASLYRYVDRIAAQPTDLPLRCPCCGCKTLSERGAFDICKVCYWEDDGQDDYDADLVRGGPNGALSLSAARANYREFGACEWRLVAHVRPPRPEELPESA
jgi:Cysteine-rich CPCC